MITDSELREAIYNKYIRPTERKSKHVAGAEFEFPIVNMAGDDEYAITEAVDFDVVHRTAESFTDHFGFRDVMRDDDGEIYNAADTKTGDALSFDCSYNTLELSLGIRDDLNDLDKTFRSYYSALQSKLQESGHMVTGFGINPGYKVNRIEPVETERYRMLLHHLRSYVNYGNIIQFHHYPHFGLFSCASQVQLDVEKDDLVETLNTFSRLEPLKAILFANSVFDADEHHRFSASRDYLWRQSMHGINPHNVDDYNTAFHSIDEIISYITTMSLYCVERDGKYINFRPTVLSDYFRNDNIEGEYFDAETGGYKELRFRPQIEDMDYLRSFKFNDLTFRGTVEFRSVCEQPARDAAAPAAFHLGLFRRLHDLTELLAEDKAIYQQGYNVGELRRLFVARELPGFVDRKKARKLILRVIDLAAEGLQERGLGEEKYLSPLYDRVEKMTNPAVEMMRKEEAGVPVKEVVREYGTL